MHAHVYALISHAFSERGHNPLNFNLITSNFSSCFSEKFNPSGFEFYKFISHERKYNLKKNMESYNLLSVNKRGLCRCFCYIKTNLQQKKILTTLYIHMPITWYFILVLLLHLYSSFHNNT